MRPDLQRRTGSVAFGSSAEWPTLIHVTHPKSGSQWIHRILRGCAPDRVIEPEYERAQFLKRPIRSGMIYPSIFVSKEEFDIIALPPFSRRFVVIRDLRDALVSLYFSLKISHLDDSSEIGQMRSKLRALSSEEGLLWLLDTPEFHHSAAIQQSWYQSGEPLIRYEELLQRDEELLENLFLHQCRLPIDPQVLRDVVRASRFEALTGRRTGEEEIHSHYRKGMAGDWHNHFGARVTAAFKERFGALLIATGYERNFDWQARAQPTTDSAHREQLTRQRHEHAHDLRSELERRLALINGLNSDLKRAQADSNEKERQIALLHGEAEARLNLIKRLDADLRSALARVQELEKQNAEPD
jgi:hypothetical protein